MLNTQPNIKDTDGFYERLVETHQDLSFTQSQSVNAKLILLLANHIGDNAVLEEALRLARGEMKGEAEINLAIKL